MRELERQLTEALYTFEPRILRNSLKVRSRLEGNMIALELEGELWAAPAAGAPAHQDQAGSGKRPLHRRRVIAWTNGPSNLYNIELRHLREMAGEFAREYPNIAGRLALDRDAKEACPIRTFERLLEGFAWLAARVHLKLDADFHVSPRPAGNHLSALPVPRFRPWLLCVSRSIRSSRRWRRAFQFRAALRSRAILARANERRACSRRRTTSSYCRCECWEARYFTRDVQELEPRARNRSSGSIAESVCKPRAARLSTR